MLNRDLRAHFLLDPEVRFLNHGSFGACPREVFGVYQNWQRQLESQPVAFLDPLRGMADWMGQSRAALGAYLNADADDLVGVPNATHALNIVLRSLPLQQGDEILTTDHEYGALDKTLAFVAARTGARIVRVKVPMPLVDEATFTAALAAGLSDRTRVVFISHITSATALLFPIAPIVAMARARGIWTVIDGAHTPGHIPLDLQALGADFYAGNCHKWIMSPKGAAFLHVRPAWQDMMIPLVVSHGWQEDRSLPGPMGGTGFVDALSFQGTLDPSAWLTVPAALDFLTRMDWPEVARDCALRVGETAARIARLTGLPPLSADAYRAPQMAAMEVPRTDPAALKNHLWHEHRIEIPVYDWQERSFVRLSVQGYTTDQDLDALVEALSAYRF